MLESYSGGTNGKLFVLNGDSDVLPYYVYPSDDPLDFVRNIFVPLVADLDGDGKLEIVFSETENIDGKQYLRLKAITANNSNVIHYSAPWPTAHANNQRTGQAPNPKNFQIQKFIRGDVNEDGFLSIDDATFIINYLFVSGDAPKCLNVADVDGNGKLTIEDPINLISYLFFGIPVIDPTEGEIICSRSI